MYGHSARSMIHALAKEDEELERKARHERRKHRHRLRKLRHGDKENDDGTDKESEKPAKSAGDELATYASPPEHAATTPTLARTQECESPASPESRQLEADLKKNERKQKRRAEKNSRDSGDEADMTKSSLLAIHRPIQQRRLTESGVLSGDEERDRMPLDPAKIREIEQLQEEETRKNPGMGSRQGTSSTLASIDTVERREKLSDKLMDVFSLDEPEEVVAGKGFPDVVLPSPSKLIGLGLQSTLAGSSARF